MFISLGDDNETISKFCDQSIHVCGAGPSPKDTLCKHSGVSVTFTPRTPSGGAISILPAAILEKLILLNQHKNDRLVIQLPFVVLKSQTPNAEATGLSPLVLVDSICLQVFNHVCPHV